LAEFKCRGTKELAAWLLADDPKWNADRLDQTQVGSETVQVSLKRRVPIFLVYETAAVASDGEVRFFRDIYGEDAKLHQQLEESHPQSYQRRTGPTST
jgi:murein L,D-transpeptidase YcbB/YkuD